MMIFGKQKKPSLKDTENAFQPAKEISDIERFAGRQKPINDSFLALLSEGANIAIVGNRGIGKTSLARQIQKFGSGNNDLIKKLNLKLDHKFDYQVFYLACGDEINNRDDLLKRLLTSDACLGSWLYEIPKTRTMLHALSPKLKAEIFGVGAEIGGTASIQETHEHVAVPQSTEGVFENVVRQLREEKLTRDGILIVIDEFDQISNPSGLGPFLKALATNVDGVKFCIVGVAKDIQELMKEHESADRLFAGAIVPLDPMSAEELSAIIDIAEEQTGKWFKFEQDARDKIVAMANGHPYLVHLIGKFALRRAFMDDKQSITSDDIDAVLQTIAENASDPVLEGRYRTAVASSKQRESVLKALACNQDDRGEIWTTDAYKAALENGVDNASQYVGQLVTDDFGAEIERVRERYYRFKDSLFAAYVQARPSMRGLAADS